MKTGMSGWVDLLFPLSKPSDQSLALFDAGFFAKVCTNSKTWAQIWPHFRRHQRHLRHLLHQRNTPIFHNKHFPLIIRLFYQLIHVLLSGTPRVRIAPGMPKSLKTKRFQAFLFLQIQSTYEEIQPHWKRIVSLRIHCFRIRKTLSLPKIPHNTTQSRFFHVRLTSPCHHWDGTFLAYSTM